MDYDETFYDAIGHGSRQSAAILLSELCKMLPIKSLADVGCGGGDWLNTASRLGIPKLIGYDGPWSEGRHVEPTPYEWISLNLEELIALDDIFDCIICLEVAEHLRSESAVGLIEALTGSSDAVLFSAAIPFQGGLNHINEQPQSYWAGLFDAHSFVCHDVIRPAVWDNEHVDWWYRQNTLLFAKRGTTSDKLIKESGQRRGILDCIHPDHFKQKIAEFSDNKYFFVDAGVATDIAKVPVSAEMASAGASVLYRKSNIVHASDAAIVVEIYRAMEAIRLSTADTRLADAS